LLSTASGVEPAPETKKVPVTTEFHGRSVVDDYQWLENPEDPAVQRWTEEQTERSRRYLDSIPERAKILAELKNAIQGKTVRYGEPRFGGGKLFVTKLEQPKPQPSSGFSTPQLEEALPGIRRAMEFFIPGFPAPEKGAIRTRMTDFGDGVKQVVFGGEESLFLRSIKDALRGQVLRLPLGEAIQTVGDAKVVVAESQNSAIDLIAATAKDLLVEDVAGGPSRLRHFDRDGRALADVSLPPLAAVANIIATDDGKFLYSVTRYTQPPTMMVFDPQANQISRTDLSARLAVSFDRLFF
jgi:prolyl oligopeptidase PreP (S9A serine peptidase family)